MVPLQDLYKSHVTVWISFSLILGVRFRDWYTLFSGNLNFGCKFRKI